MREAAREGLAPADYGASDLERRAGALLTAPDATAALAFDATLTAALGRYLKDLQVGRVDPRRLGFRVPARTLPPEDTAVRLRQAVGEGRLADLVAAATPAMPPYRALREALARHRELARDPRLQSTWPGGPKKLAPGDEHAIVPALRDRLQQLGDLETPPDPSGTVEAPNRYDEALAEAVRGFQRRHGLEADAVVGRATHAALAVPMASRVRQIELAMERLRWLPPPNHRRFIAVNIPMFQLWSHGGDRPGPAPPSMAVIVGKAVRHETPVFIGEMRQVIFHPYWNVPRSIVRNEVLPRLPRDPGYLSRQQMELVAGPGDDSPVVPTNAANLERLAAGALRLRQRPGEHNALGRVKFSLPNDEAIYLHDTPTRGLFARPRRDFSHGCVRVAEPAALAHWLLAAQGWSREQVDEALAARPVPRTVNLDEGVAVLMYYVTAMAVPGERQVRFADDLYGHDADLERALSSRR